MSVSSLIPKVLHTVFKGPIQSKKQELKTSVFVFLHTHKISDYPFSLHAIIKNITFGVAKGDRSHTSLKQHDGE